VKLVTILVLNVNMTLLTVPHVQESEIQIQSQVVTVHSVTMKIVLKLVLNVTTLVKHVQMVQMPNVLHVLQNGTENKMVHHVHANLVSLTMELQSVLNVNTNVLNVQDILPIVVNVPKEDQEHQIVNVTQVPMIMDLNLVNLDVPFVMYNAIHVVVLQMVVTLVQVTESMLQLVVVQQDSMMI